MSETYEPGELFVYMNGDRWELGEVKSANNTGTGYFCWYSTGDTAANTPTSHMHKLANAGWSHIERRECMAFSKEHDRAEFLTRENDKLRELVRDMWPHVRYRSRMCQECELPCETSDECLLYEPMRQRMRELGVEV